MRRKAARAGSTARRVCNVFVAFALALSSLPPRITISNVVVQRAYAEGPSERSESAPVPGEICGAALDPVGLRSDPVRMTPALRSCPGFAPGAMTYDVIDAQKRSYAENERLIRNILAPLCHVTSLAPDLHILAPCGADLGRLSGAAANRSSTTAPVEEWETFKRALLRLDSQKPRAGSREARDLVKEWDSKITRAASSVVLFRESSKSSAGTVLPGGALRPITLQEIVTLVLDNKLDGKSVPKGVGGLNNGQFSSFLKVHFDSACLFGSGTPGFSALNACLGQIESGRGGPRKPPTFTTQLRSERVLTAPQSPLKLSPAGDELRLERTGGCKEQAVYIRVSNSATQEVIADLPVLLEDICGANGTPTPTPTATFTYTPSATPTPSTTFTHTVTPSPTFTHTPTPTFTHTVTPSPTFTHTPTPTSTHNADSSPREGPSLFFESDPDALAAYTERSMKSVLRVGKANSTVRLGEFLRKVQSGQKLDQVAPGKTRSLKVDGSSQAPNLEQCGLDDPKVSKGQQVLAVSDKSLKNWLELIDLAEAAAELRIRYSSEITSTGLRVGTSGDLSSLRPESRNPPPGDIVGAKYGDQSVETSQEAPRITAGGSAGQSTIINDGGPSGQVSQEPLRTTAGSSAGQSTIINDGGPSNQVSQQPLRTTAGSSAGQDTLINDGGLSGETSREPLRITADSSPVQGTIIIENPTDKNLCVSLMRLPAGVSLAVQPKLADGSPYVIPANGHLEIGLRDAVPDLFFNPDHRAFCEESLADVATRASTTDLFEAMFVVSDCSLPAPEPLRALSYRLPISLSSSSSAFKCDFRQILPTMYGDPQSDSGSDSGGPDPFSPSELRDLFSVESEKESESESCPEGLKRVELPGPSGECDAAPKRFGCVKDPDNNFGPPQPECPEGQHELPNAGPAGECPLGSLANPQIDPFDPANAHLLAQWGDPFDPNYVPPPNCACTGSVFSHKENGCIEDPCNPDQERWDPCESECLRICPGNTIIDGLDAGTLKCKCPKDGEVPDNGGICHKIPTCNYDQYLTVTDQGAPICKYFCRGGSEYVPQDGGPGACKCVEGRYANPLGQCDFLPTCQSPEVVTIDPGGWAVCRNYCTELVGNAIYYPDDGSCYCKEDFYFNDKNCVPTGCNPSTQFWNPTEKRCDPKCQDGIAHDDPDGRGWRCCPSGTELQGDVCVPSTPCPADSCYSPDGGCTPRCPSGFLVGSECEVVELLQTCFDTFSPDHPCTGSEDPINFNGYTGGSEDPINFNGYTGCLECPPDSERVGDLCIRYKMCEGGGTTNRFPALDCTGSGETSPTTGQAPYSSGDPAYPGHTDPQLNMDVAPDQPGEGPQDSVEAVASPGTYDPSYAGPASVSGGSTNPNGDPNGPGSPEPDDSDAIQEYIKQLLESPIESSLGDSFTVRLRALLVDPRLFDDPHVKADLEKIERYLNSAGGSPGSAEDIGTLVGLVETLQTTINEFYTGSNDYKDYAQFVSEGWSTSYDAILELINKYRELSGDWTSFFNDEALQELELKIKEKITALAEHLMQYGNQLSPQDRERADRELAYLLEMITIYSGGHFESGQNVQLASLLYLETWRAGNDILLSVALSFWAARVSKFGPEAAAIAAAYSTYTAERARNLKNNYINNWQGGSTRENFINTAQAHYESFEAAEYNAIAYAAVAAVSVWALGRGNWAAGKIPSAAIKELVQTILKALAATLGIKMVDDLHTKLSEGLDDVINGSIDDDYLRVQEGWVNLTDVGLDAAQLVNLHALLSKLMKANKIKVPEPRRAEVDDGLNDMDPGLGPTHRSPEERLRSLSPEQRQELSTNMRLSEGERAAKLAESLGLPPDDPRVQDLMGLHREPSYPGTLEASTSQLQNKIDDAMEILVPGYKNMTSAERRAHAADRQKVRELVRKGVLGEATLKARLEAEDSLPANVRGKIEKLYRIQEPADIPHMSGRPMNRLREGGIYNPSGKARAVYVGDREFVQAYAKQMRQKFGRDAQLEVVEIELPEKLLDKWTLENWQPVGTKMRHDTGMPQRADPNSPGLGVGFPRDIVENLDGLVKSGEAKIKAIPFEEFMSMR